MLSSTITRECMVNSKESGYFDLGNERDGG